MYGFVIPNVNNYVKVCVFCGGTQYVSGLNCDRVVSILIKMVPLVYDMKQRRNRRMIK